ncbi:TetR/AcrR family transcriptional regulator [Desulfopila sp. IMCC35008]|uniref:TetR/AcrR family transcriptional regulator n=1 Tax=Desulfopila sp. IMCC35008 TaxID=2653858 RepID=UPI0013D62808|nr:TetR/AcrR family transcriptional regulator [Desulfopila sp. IMCC35008]
MSDTRTKILDVAEDLIQRVGLNAMSYQHISEAVGIRKASIHHHFPKKDDLVDELLERCRLSYDQNYTSIVEGSGTAPEKLHNLAGLFLKGLTSNKVCLIGSMSTDRNTLQEHSCRILEKSIQRTVTTISHVFRQGKEEGSLTFSGSEEEAAYGYISFLIGAQIVARCHGGELWFKKSAQTMIEAFAA